MSDRRIAFLFPGQGSQAVGMGRDAAERSPAAAALMRQADEVLGFPLTQLCTAGPEEELKKTENTQPALFASSAATLEVLREAGIAPFAVAGHSLGEYSALYAAGVFDYAAGLKLVRTRGEAFAQAAAARPGAMAAILGLEIARIHEIVGAVAFSGKTVVAANMNEPLQTVISGETAAVNEACEALKAAGAKRCVPLPVSGAFHSPLVAPAAETMRHALAAVAFREPQILFVNNVDASPLTKPEYIKESLIQQVTGSVRWVESIEVLVKHGVTAFVEVGSGKALSGMVRRIAKDILVYTTESSAAIDATLAALKA